MGQEFGAKVAGGDTLGKEIYLYGGFGAKMEMAASLAKNE